MKPSSLIIIVCLLIALSSQSECNVNQECAYNCCDAETKECIYSPFQLDCVGSITTFEFVILVMISPFIIIVIPIILIIKCINAIRRTLKRNEIRKIVEKEQSE